MAKLERETGARSPTGAEEMVTYFERCGFGIELERHYSLGVSLRLAETIAQILLSKHWYVSHCPPGKSLITTDTPFAIFAPPNVVNAPYGVGLATLGATAFVPLGAEIGLSFAEPGDGVTHLDTRDAVIRDMNLRLAVRSKRFVFARDERHLRSRQFDKPGNPCSVSSTTRRLTNPVAPSPTELDPGHSLRMARTLGADKCALYVKKRCRANTAQLREAPRVDGALHVMPLVRDCYA
jgi:hypothetical protein